VAGAAQLLQRRLDRGLEVVDGAGLGVQHHRAARAVLGIQAGLLEQLRHRLGFGVRQLEIVLVVGTAQPSQ
jgi:hypothetical protein